MKFDSKTPIGRMVELMFLFTIIIPLALIALRIEDYVPKSLIFLEFLLSLILKPILLYFIKIIDIIYLVFINPLVPHD